jgi:hypothetical protein
LVNFWDILIIVAGFIDLKGLVVFPVVDERAASEFERPLFVRVGCNHQVQGVELSTRRGLKGSQLQGIFCLSTRVRKEALYPKWVPLCCIHSVLYIQERGIHSDPNYERTAIDLFDAQRSCSAIYDRGSLVGHSLNQCDKLHRYFGVAFLKIAVLAGRVQQRLKEVRVARHNFGQLFRGRWGDFGRIALPMSRTEAVFISMDICASLDGTRHCCCPSGTCSY